MDQLSSLLGKYQARGIGAAVSRAVVLEEANRWLGRELPAVAGRARITAVVGKTVVAQAVGGLVATEVRLKGPALLAHLRRQYPSFPLDGLKCLVRGSRLVGDDAEPSAS